MPEEIKNQQQEQQDIIEKEEKVDEQICLVALKYLENIYLKAKDQSESISVPDLIKEKTPIVSIIKMPLHKIGDYDKEISDEKINLYLNDFFGEVDSLCQNDDFPIDALADLIKKKKQNIVDYLGLTEVPAPEDKLIENSPKFSFLKINEIKNIEHDQGGKYMELLHLDSNLSEKSHLIEMHMEGAYTKPDIKIGWAEIKKDLSLLAEYIIDYKPEAEGIVGTSWLIDALGARLGFKKINNEVPGNDLSTWLQYIDENGEIDKNRLQILLETGKPKYKSVSGYIEVVDFLNRWLPDNRRGEVKLKIINPERATILDNIKKEGKKAKADWEPEIFAGKSFEEFLNKHTFLLDLIRPLEAREQTDVLKYFKSMWQQKIPWSQISSHETDSIKLLSKKIIEQLYDQLTVTIPPRDKN